MKWKKILLVLLFITTVCAYTVVSYASDEHHETASHNEEEVNRDENHHDLESHGGHDTLAAHEENGTHEGHGGHEESWWRFPGWQVVFAGIACLYFALVLAWLPLLVVKKGEGGH